MTIEATCDSCYRTYNLKDALAGRKVRCKECGETFTVPQPGAAPAEPAGDPWDVDDAFDEDFASAAPPPPMPTRGRKKKKRRRKRAEPEKSSGFRLGLIGILSLVGGGLFLMMCLVGIFVRPVLSVMLFCMGLTGAGLGLVGGIGCLMAAFEEDAVCGIMYLFMPFYSLYYVITRIGDIWKLVLMNIGGTALVFGAMFLSAAIEAFDEGQRMAAGHRGEAPLDDEEAGFFDEIFEAAAQDDDSHDNLKQIVNASHNHHDTYQQFPPHAEERGDEPLVSWQTSLLPFIDKERLYDRINRVAEWDAPANSDANRTIVREYLQPSISETTDARNLAVSHYALNQALLVDSGGLRLRDFTDGSSNTVMCGEVGGGYKPWADPSNARDLAAGLLPGPETFGNPSGRGAFMAFADGSVRWISSDTNPDILKALSTPDGNDLSF